MSTLSCFILAAFITFGLLVFSILGALALACAVIYFDNTGES